MVKVLFEGFRFENQQQLKLYQDEGAEKGMFKFGKPVLTAEIDAKSLNGLLTVVAGSHHQGTIIKAYQKNELGHWAYFGETEGKKPDTWEEENAKGKKLTESEEN